jgi:hypothetical protein
MSYAIANIIYGVPITTKLLEYVNVQKGDDAESYLEEIGFDLLYSAGGDTVGYLGFSLGQVDECTDVLRLSDLNAFIENRTSEMMVGLQTLYDELPLDIKILMGTNGINTDFYIVWSSS